MRASRRIVFHGLGALGVAVALAGCGATDDPSADDTRAPSPPGTDEPNTPEATESPSEPPSEKPTEKPPALATTAEVPVGGGIVLFEERIVLTQPQKGRFEAFSAVCTHQGETVGVVKNGIITCTFHGSQYDAATGKVTEGPAASGLDPIGIKVVKGEILLA